MMCASMLRSAILRMSPCSAVSAICAVPSRLQVKHSSRDALLWLHSASDNHLFVLRCPRAGVTQLVDANRNLMWGLSAYVRLDGLGRRQLAWPLRCQHRRCPRSVVRY